MTLRASSNAKFWALAITLGGTMLSPVAAAQDVPVLRSEADISRERVPLDIPQVSDFDLRIQTPERSAVPRSVDELEFSISGIKVEGADHYPADEVQSYFAPLIGKTITLEALRNAASRLEARYKSDGYVLTRAFVPPQQVKEGTLTVRVVEGYVSSVAVDAEDAATRRRLERILRPLIGKKPVRISDIESSLLRINDMPGISATSVLRPGDELGATDLLLTARADPNQYSLGLNNSSSEELGPWLARASATLNRPFDRIGALDAALSFSGNLRELWSGSLSYAEPIGSSGLTASIGALVGVARPGGRIRELDVLSNVRSYSARLRYPLLRGRTMSLYAGAGLAINSNHSDALGVRIISDRQTTAEASLLWQQNGWANGITSVSFNLYQGLQALGTMDRGAPLASVANFDPDFTKLAWSVQRSQRLPGRFSAYAVAQGQYSQNTLLSGELITFGGSSIGRGYVPSLIAGDRGIGGLVELRYDLPVEQGEELNRFQLYLFGDAARTTTVASGANPRLDEHIASLGIGFRAELFQQFRIDAYLADARRNVAGTPKRDPRFIVDLSFNL